MCTCGDKMTNLRDYLRISDAAQVLGVSQVTLRQDPLANAWQCETRSLSGSTSRQRRR